jgi:photosystem II stability/assembly factor-like uncharacterized protein
MKKLYTLSFLILFTLQLRAQWTSYSIPAVTNLFRSVYFLNPDTGYIVGEYDGINPSPILTTKDGGATFINYNSGTQKPLRAVHFIDASTGYVVGFEGKLLQSTDGGVNWTGLNSGTTKNLRSVYFPSHDIGYICGGGGTVLKTTDAGNNWTSMNVNTDTDLINIRFATDDIGYVVASAVAFDKGSIYKTTDGGTTWTAVYSDALNGFLGLAVADANTVYAGGNNDVIVKTTDGGANWTQVYSGLSGHRIRGGFALNANTVWLVCDFGDIFYTNDGGTTWINQTVNTTGLYGIMFPTPDVGYASGAGGEILKYGCTSLSAAGSINGPSEICANDSAQFSIGSVFGANTYTWNVPAGSTITSGNGSTSITVVFGSSSGTISVTAANGCDSVSSSLSITVNPAPAIPTITFINNILSSGLASSYQWYLNGSAIPGATGQNYTPAQNGTYSVVVTNSFGCASSSGPFAVIGLSVNEIQINGALEISPNPLINSAIIVIGGSSGEEYLSISDVRGKIISETPVNVNDRITLDRKNFAEGIYFISLLDHSHSLLGRSKLIVQ